MKRAHDRIDLLHTFVKIVETGSLSNAARAMDTTQPTISRRLLDLERLLGCKLATRTTANFSLTDEGRLLLAQAREVIDRWTGLTDRLSGAQSRPEGTLRLIGPSAWSTSFLTDVVTDLCAAHPDLRVEMTLSDHVVDMLSSGAECWLFVGPVPDPGLVVTRLGAMERILIATPALLKRVGPVSVSNLSSMPFVGLVPHVIGALRLLNRTGRVRTVTVEPQLQMDNLIATYRAVLNGAGIGGASAWLCHDDLKSGRVRRVLPEWTLEAIPVHVAMLPGIYRPARVAAFIDTLRARMKITPGFVAA